MLKLLAKKGKNEKGFTLIELIVVIAIIGILALLLVPQFAGFTEDARVSNDRNACETIERAFMTLIANETFKVPSADVEVTISKADPAVFAVTGNLPYRNTTPAAWGNATATQIQTETSPLTGTLKIQAPNTHTTGWKVTIKNDGSVTCEVS